MNLNESKLENQQLSEEVMEIKARHRQEIQHLTEIYEEKLKYVQGPDKEFSLIDYRLQELEDKFKKQVECNFELIEKVTELNKQQEKQLQTIKLLEIQKFNRNSEKEGINKLVDNKKQKKSKKLLETDGAKKTKKLGKKEEENETKKKNKKKSV